MDLHVYLRNSRCRVNLNGPTLHSFHAIHAALTKLSFQIRVYDVSLVAWPPVVR
jgi:hypothetical protein